MSKLAKVGVYGNKTRSLQSRLAYERGSQTFKYAGVYLYLGSRENATPALTDVQITTFMEVPDRAYNATPIEINISPEALPEQTVDLSQFGIMNPLGDEHVFRVHVTSYDELGRPIRVGDVMEIEFFEREGRRAFWEIIDVDRSQEYEKYYSIIKAIPLDDKREVDEIPINGSNAGILGEYVDQLDDETDTQVPFNDADTSGITVDDDNIDQGDEFDPISNDDIDSFLDDPGKTF